MDRELFWIVSVFVFALGASIASFLNVVIWRVPRGESIVKPASHCPKCDAPIRWYQNIPILSYLALGGACANCKAPISPRYILVETLGGLLFWFVFVRFAAFQPPTFESAFIVVVMWIWVSLMIAGSFIDFDHKLLPDFTTVGGMILGVASALVYVLAFHCPWSYFLISLSGLALGFGLLYLVRFLGSLIFRREAMGLGDVFLMGAVGAMFGPVAVLLTIILSSIFGSVVGLSLVALSKTKRGRFVEIPFGPYICLGCLVYMFYGRELVSWYLRLLGF